LSAVDKATLPTQQFILNNTITTVKMKIVSFWHILPPLSL